MKGGPKFCDTCRKAAQAMGREVECKDCPDRPPDVREGNIAVLNFYALVANCVRYASTMDGPFVSGFNWTDIKAVAEMAGVEITKRTLKKLRIIESLLIEEGMAKYGNKRNQNQS